MNWKATIAIVALLLAGVPAFGQAPDAPPGDGRQRGGNWDPAEMQRRMVDRIKEQLKAPDDEWKVIEPKLQKVMAAMRDSRFGGGFGGRRGGGPGGPGGDSQDTGELAVASRELRTVLERDATQEDIDQKLAAYRAAREKTRVSLETARKDLKEILTARQEATLVLMGMLE